VCLLFGDVVLTCCYQPAATDDSQLFSLKVPFQGIVESAVLFKVVQGIRPARKDCEDCPGVPMTNHVWNLIDACWNQEPASRPSMAEADARLSELSMLLLQTENNEAFSSGHGSLASLKISPASSPASSPGSKFRDEEEVSTTTSPIEFPVGFSDWRIGQDEDPMASFVSPWVVGPHCAIQLSSYHTSQSL
jgi:hypothetical protein